MTGRVGARGLTVLAIVGMIGLVLAVLGWTGRGTEPVYEGSSQIAVSIVDGGAAR